MMLRGAALLNALAERIIARYLADSGSSDVSFANHVGESVRDDDVDLTYTRSGCAVRAKVKADPYFGVDPAKIASLSLPFYRSECGQYALESVADASTREPGWALRSTADELLYYFVAIDQPEEELADLVGEPDEALFPALRVVRDDLRVLPLGALNEWFREHHEKYTSRPVQVGERATWCRLIPCAVLDSGVRGTLRIGPIYRR